MISLFLACAPARSQDVTVSPSAYDRYAASQVQNVKHHALPSNNAVSALPRTSEVTDSDLQNRETTGESSPAATRYPADVQYHGGKVVEHLEQHIIYVNLGSSPACSTIATCWGNPHAFLRDLSKSEFIHVVDQYVGKTENDRYRVSERVSFVTYPTTSNPFTDADMLAIVHAVATSLPHTPTGYENLYHIFLVPGQDECFDSTYSVCYSPDNPNTEYFCAYHGSGDFTDIGHVLYTVQPFQNNDSCSSRPDGPNGQLADSTTNNLSHEVFETISDPDGTAWWNGLDSAVYESEIADECSYVVFFPTAIYFDPALVILNGTPYAAQPEYSNPVHACRIAP
jgi:hypothetical protein